MSIKAEFSPIKSMEGGFKAVKRLASAGHFAKGDESVEHGSKRLSLSRLSLSLYLKSEEGGMNLPSPTKRGSVTCAKARRPVARLVNKDGSYHVEHLHPSHGLIKNFRNTFPFLLEVKWRWIIFGCAVCFPISWVLFAILYYAIAHGNGDFESKNIMEGVYNGSDTTHTNCIANANGFDEIFIFSVESQMTIGYGFRYPNSKCPALWVILCVQYVFGAVMQGCICGIIWARLLRPKRRGQEVVFSQNAIINQNKDGRLCLMFRLSDIAGNNLINASVRMFMAEKRKAWLSEDDLFSFRLNRLALEQEEMLLLWPSIVTHVIDEHSPIYDYSKADLERADFELIVTVGGTVESTGLAVETRTSYMTNEILWGRRFQPMNFIGLHNSKVKVHYLEFDNTYYVETPTVSAKKLDELLKGSKNG